MKNKTSLEFVKTQSSPPLFSAIKILDQSTNSDKTHTQKTTVGPLITYIYNQQSISTDLAHTGEHPRVTRMSHLDM